MDDVTKIDEGDPATGCAAGMLEVGTEFSHDGGRTWTVVRTPPRYVDDSVECLTLRFMASPAESPGLGAWQELELEDGFHVLLDRMWGARTGAGR